MNATPSPDSAFRRTVVQRCRRAVAVLCFVSVLSPVAVAQTTITNVIQGAIGVPGERDVFTFSVPADSRFYFDSLTNVNSLVWSLSGPPGSLVDSRSFAGSDAQSIGNPLLLLPAGDYRLTVEAPNAATNAYAFRLVNLAEATLLVPGTVVTNTLSPANMTDFYQFTAAAGDQFYFQRVARVGLPNAYWRLIDPYGSQVFSQGFTDVGTPAAPIRLSASGTHTLLLEGYVGDPGSGSYAFNVVSEGHVDPPVWVGTPMNPGELIAGSLVANTTNAYVFTLASPARVLFDNQTNSPSLTWTLQGPSGLIVNQRGLNVSDSFNNFGPFNLPAGDYQLRVQGNASGPYVFRLVDLALATPFTPGTQVTNTLSPAGSTKAYRFEASASGKYFFNSIRSVGLPNTQWRLIDPYNSTVFTTSVDSDQGPWTLRVAGAYTLVFDGYYFDQGSGTNVFEVLPVADGLQALTLGSVANGSITSPGQRQEYTLTLSAPARLYFDAQTNASQLRWSLSGPGGNLVNNAGFNADTLLGTVPAGSYTLAVFASVNSDATGAYRFQVLDLAAAAPLALGTPVSDALNPASSASVYTFTLAASTACFFDSQSSSGMPNAGWRLLDPQGASIFNTSLSSDQGPVVLEAGSYTLLVSGYIYETGNGTYTFRVLPVTDGAQAVTLGDVVDGAIASPGQRQRYTFALASPARLYFDVLTNSASLRWYLDGPTGTEVNNAALNSDRNLGQLAAGNYTLTIFANANSDAIGGYRFRVLDLGAAPSLTPGTIVSDPLDPANSARAYQLALANPGEYFFDHLSSSSLPNASWQLLDPQGAQVFSVGLASDAGPYALRAGTYTLIAQGYLFEVGSGNFSFNVVPVLDGTQPLALGSTATGALALPGQQQAYVFNLPATTSLYFDSLTNTSSLRWSLDGPAGRLVNGLAFSSGDQVVGPVPAGDYVLTVHAGANSDTVGGYQFRLHDLAAATPAHLNFTGATSNPPPPIVKLQAGWPSGGVLTPGRAFTISVGAVADQPITNLTLTATGAFATNQTLGSGGPYALTFQLPGTASPGSTVQFTATARDALGRLSAPANLTLNVAAPTGQGSPVVYYSRAGSPDGQLWAAALDGSFDAPLIAGEQPRISPDGRWLAFHKDNAIYSRANIYVLDLQTGNSRLLLSNPDYMVGYGWTPDSARLVFDYGCGVEVINLDGSNRRQLFTGNCYDDAPAVNGLDGRVAFHNTAAGGGIGLVNADGTGKHFITNTAPADIWPAWSPDGQWISFQDGTNYYKIHPDGTGRTALTAVPAVGDGFGGPGAWTPDGTSLIVAGTFNGANGLYSVATDGSTAVTRVSTVAGAAIDFVGSVAAIPPTSVPFVGAPLAEDLTISGTVSPANSAATWRFFAEAGQSLAFIPGAQSGFTVQGQPRWLLRDPLGAVIWDTWFGTATVPVTAVFSGEYTLVVYGWISETAPSGSFSLQIRSYGNLLPPGTLSGAPLVLGTVVSNSVAAAQPLNYTFTLNAPARVIFDSLTSDSQIRWSLSGAQGGDIVANRSFQNSDASQIADASVALLAGQYRLAVTSTDAATNSFQFRLLDFASAEVLTPGTVVSNSLAPASRTALYRFAANAGDRCYFDGLPSSGFTYNPYCRLYSPLGNILQAQSVAGDLDTFTLPQTGTYTLTVEGYVYDTHASGSYAFNLVPVSYPTNALTVGGTVSNTIPVPGERQYHTFTLPAAATLYFDALTNADFLWRLDAPWGQVSDWRSFQSSDASNIGNPAMPLAKGSYTLAVAGGGFSATGSYAFRLLDFAEAQPFTPGTPVTNALVPASSTVFYRFTGNVGDRYYFDGLPASGFTYNPYCRLYGPLGNILQAQSVAGDIDTFTLPQTGTYTLTVEGYVFDTHASGNYAFNLVPVTYPTNALTLGSTVTNTIPVPGQRQYFTFTLPAAATLYFDALTNADFQWRLDAPWGQVSDWRPFQSSDASSIANPALPLAKGSYTLAVAGGGFSTTGTYAFRLLNFADAQPFAPGTMVTNTLAPANSTVFYQFSGTAADRFYFNGLPASGFSYSPYCRLYGPEGNILQSQSVVSDVDTFALPLSGTYTLTVEGYVYDTHASGNYAFNLVPNPIPVPQPIFTSNAAPDLVVSSVSVTPSGTLQSGGSPVVHWTDSNAGGGSTSGSFTDRVTVRNAAGLVVVDAFLPYNEADAGNGPLAAGGSRNRQLAVTLPDGTNSVGTLQFTVTTDAQNGIAEANEANNSSSLGVVVTIAPYPDLQVERLSANPPSAWLPGSVVTLQWRLTNSGAGIAVTNWTDTVSVRNTATAQVIFNGTRAYTLADAGNGPLGAGEFRDRSLAFTMPTDGSAYGAFAVTVTADGAGQVFEYNDGGTAELNNTRTTTVISAPDLVPSSLAISSPGGAIRSGDTITVSWVDENLGTVETGSGFNDRVIVVNTNTSETLLNTTVSYNPGSPGNGPIPAGGSRPRSTTLVLPQGPRSVGTLQVTVSADAFNQLPEVNGDGTAEANNAVLASVPVTIASYPDLQVVNLAILPGVLASGTNVLIQWQDTNSGTATLAANWYDRITIVNTNTGTVLLDTQLFYGTNVLGPLTNGTARTRSYGFTLPDGPGAVGNLRFTVGADTFDNVFEFNPGGTGESNNVASVIVGASIAPYPDLEVVNLALDPATLASGTNVTVRWQDANTGTAPAAGSWYDRLTVVNADSGILLLDSTVFYDGGVLGALTNGTSRDRSHSFALPFTTNGAGNLRFTVTGDAHNSLFEYNLAGTGEINNSNSVTRFSSLTPLPDLVVTSLTSPASALTDHAITVRFSVTNQGSAAANGNVSQRVFVSSTPTPGSGTLAAVTAFNGPLDAGQSTNLAVTLQSPSVPGTYWLIVQTDGSENVQELSEVNNVHISATPITVQPAYVATLTVDVHSALANTPIPMHGTATLGGTGGPAALVPIRIHVMVRGTDRTFDVLTAADGTFTNVFYPLPNEAGDYQVAAAFPGVANPEVQDSFTLIGMSITPIPLLNVIEGTQVTNSTPVINLSDVPLTGLSVQVVTNQANLTVTPTLRTNTLAGFESTTLEFVVTALNASVYQSPIVLRVTSAEGATATLTMIVRVEALRPRLLTAPSSLNGPMLRGTQTPLAFTLFNQGGVPTGPLQVVLPNVPWLSLASSNSLPPLAAGTNTVITLLLNPAADLALGDYHGTLVIQSTNAGLSAPYSFRAVSDAKGDLRVTAEDEYTYFAEGAPRLTNATVVLSDALSRLPVATNYTGADGMILFTNLAEAFYIVDVAASNHNSFRQSALVVPGATTNVVAFLTRQTVRYSFTVVPTTVQDAYIFTVDSTFETQVPIPVVTIEPASIDLSQYLDSEFQVLLTIRNHGLIDAESVKLNIPSTPRLQLTPLVSDLGKLKANSSLTVPLMVKRIGTSPISSSGDVLQRQDYLSGECSVTGEMLWNYLCGPSVVDKSTAFYAFDSTGCDLVALFREVYHLVPDVPPGTITSDDFFDYLESLNPVTDFEAPAGYHFECNSAPGVPIVATTVRNRAAGPAGQGEPLTRQADNSVCAKVRLRLDQKGVLTRDAFKATLEIDNDVPSALQNVRVDLVVTGETGGPQNDSFAITPPALSGLTAADGTGTLAGNSIGTANWTLIPTLDAAPTNGYALYLVGGTLRYTQDGTELSIPLGPTPIQVFPQPELVVRYFHDRDVYSDDPFTPEIEPSIPYSLAVQVNNVGYGAAQALTITSGKPQILDNEKGLLIDFNILGAQMEQQPLAPGLEASFGRIPPATNKLARWLFTSSLQGSFTNFSASFSQVDPFGKPRLSLVRSVEIHELTHIVDENGPSADGRPDLLVNDVPDPDFLPDTIYLSDGSTNSVASVTNAVIEGILGTENLSVTASAAAPAGWSYFRFQDPGQGQYRLTKVLRQDASEVPLGTNVWTTDRFILGGSLRPIRTNLVHLLDYNSAGTYTLFYVAAATTNDAVAPSSLVAALPASSPPAFTVQWSGSDNAGGSGVAVYDVFVSVNGGGFTPWITNTPLTASIYTGVTGDHYAFYSRATDVAGNREAAHPSADAQTTVSVPANTPPILAPIPLQSVPSGSLFSLFPSATDVDVPAQTLTWSLLPGAPAAALLSPINGHLTWQPGPSDNGRTQAFTLVVTDNGSPSLSATQTFGVVVVRTNHAPVIAAVPPQVNVAEGTLLSLQLTANDPDASDALTWEWTSTVPAGLDFSPSTGLLTWTPGETQGPGTYIASIVVRDNGTPPLSDTVTFAIRVEESNRPPVLSAFGAQTASVLEPLVLSCTATDPDLPANSLRFSLGAGAPSHARIDPITGVFTWPPAEDRAGITNLITVVVTDDGVPPLSASNTLSVVVGHYVKATLGSTLVQAGQAGAVPLSVDVSTPITNVSFTLTASPAGLTNLSLAAPAPPLGSATLQQITPGVFQLDLQTLNGQTLFGQQTVSTLHFVARSNAASAFVRLQISNVSARHPTGDTLARTLSADGLVTLVNAEPLLQARLAADGSRELVLFGKPGLSYQLQYESALSAPGDWRDWVRVPMTNTTHVLQVPDTGAPNAFLRAFEFIAAPPLVDATLGTDRSRRLTLYGRPGVSYELQSKTNLADAGPWTVSLSYTPTNSFHFLTNPNPGSPIIYYRISGP